MEKRAIVWFRNDLRLDDNESLVEAAAQARVVPVYVFDERTFKGETRNFGFRKTGIHRTRFTIAAVRDLRERLRAIGSDLIVRIGIPEDIIYQLARELRTNWVYCNRERTEEEVLVQDRLESQLWSIGQELRYARGKMLYHTADLPFPVNHTPDIFTQYRKEVERIVQVREPIEPPETLPALPQNTDAGDIPTLQSFGFAAYQVDERAVLPFFGGETTALRRLEYYLWKSNLASTYKETRNQLLGESFSTKFSAWLAAGCLSPKRIYHELVRYEAERGANESTYWIFFELLWRDFFRLQAKKHRNAIFNKSGPKGVELSDLSEDKAQFQLWSTGQTGVPFVDACMRELQATGFMSNRGRQNVASFLVKDLKLNWQMGAEYFESMLVDYDVASNWGNWNYVAGVGSDPREDRYFNILSQAKRYDPQGDFVRTWVPELAALQGDSIHRPDLLNDEELEKLGVVLGEQYPRSVVDMDMWDSSTRKSAPRSKGGSMAQSH